MDFQANLKQVLLAATISAGIMIVVVPHAIARGAQNPHYENLKKLGKTFLLYGADHDGALPFANYREEFNGWRSGTLVPSPADVVDLPKWQEPAQIRRAESMWRNSLVAYGDFPSTVLDGAEERSVGEDKFNGVPNVTSPTMNGLLHAYPIASVSAPGLVPLIWHGLGKINYKGRAFSNPALACNSSPQCLFNPTDHPSPGTNHTTYSGTFYIVASPAPTFWIEDKTTPMIQVDGSLKIVPIGTKIKPDSYTFHEQQKDPFAQVDERGAPLTNWSCGEDGSFPKEKGTYPCFFRPDKTD